MSLSQNLSLSFPSGLSERSESQRVGDGGGVVGKELGVLCCALSGGGEGGLESQQGGVHCKSTT